MPPGQESPQKNSKVVVKETKTETKTYEYETTRVDELISKADILIQEVEDLLSAIRDVPTSEKELNGLRSIIREEVKAVLSEHGGHVTEDTIVLRTISREQAKKEIIDLFEKSEKLYYYDIAEALSLDLELVVELVAELESEGEIGAT